MPVTRPVNTSRKRYLGFLETGRAPAAPPPETSNRERRGRYARRYFGLLAPHRWALVLVLFLALFGIASDMVWPLVSKYLIDGVVLNTAMPLSDKMTRLVVLGGAMATLFLFNSGVNLARSLRMQLLNSKLAFGLRTQLFHRILRLPIGEITEMKTGGVISRLSSDVDNTTGLLQLALVSPVLSLLRLTVTLGIIFILNWQIATAVLLAIPPVMLAQHLWVRRVRTIWRSIGQDRSEIDARVSEGLTGIRVVRGFGREKKEELAYAIGHHTVIRKQMLATGTQRGVAVIWDFIMPMTQLTIIGFGGYLVLQGKATLGTLVAFQGYVWRLLEPVLQIVNALSETQRGLAAMDRVFEVMDKPLDKPDAPDAVDAPTPVREIRFSDVSFAYRPGIEVIHDFDLAVRGGSVVALVGPSGAGKTTITDLVARFHDPTEGAILLNGVDLLKIKLRSLRSLWGIVGQEVFLFDGTVRENIAYGRARASLQEIIEAAKRANAHEFIERLPEKYETTIGERGVKLSGGQRQRLSIARALLADPELLILYEATSNLDTESEQLIQASMKELLANRTTFVIAHRLSTITHADAIVVLDRGRIVELGNHDQLMEKRGAYYRMVLRQRQRAPSESGTPLDWGISAEGGV